MVIYYSLRKSVFNIYICKFHAYISTTCLQVVYQLSVLLSMSVGLDMPQRLVPGNQPDTQCWQSVLTRVLTHLVVPHCVTDFSDKTCYVNQVINEMQIVCQTSMSCPVSCRTIWMMNIFIGQIQETHLSPLEMCVQWVMLLCGTSLVGLAGQHTFRWQNYDNQAVICKHTCLFLSYRAHIHVGWI